jgi:hypothetical protein
MSHLSWEQFRDRVPSACDLVFVPVGTLEAHGAIPLGTDTIIPEALAADLAPKLNGLVAPPIAYGVTNSLLPYPGSTTVSSATFSAYLFEATAGLSAGSSPGCGTRSARTPPPSSGGDSRRRLRLRSIPAQSPAMRESRRRRWWSPSRRI